MSETYTDGTGTGSVAGASRTDAAYAPRTYERDEKTTETRRSFKTTEFFVMIAAIAAIIVMGYASDDSLDANRIWTLVAIVASAYMVARGLAKAGSYNREGDDQR